MLPDFASGHVVLAAEVERAGVIDVAALERRGIGLAVIEPALDAPVLVRAPFRVADDDFVPVGDQSVGKHELASARFIDDFLLAVPGGLRRVGLPLRDPPVGIESRVALVFGRVVQPPHGHTSLGPAHGETAKHVERCLWRCLAACLVDLAYVDHHSSLLMMSCRASANQPGPAVELKMILPLTAARASL